MYTLFIFRRDLRIIDNLGLIYAMKNCKNIVPIFIFTPEQVTSKNKFRGDNCIQFMIESLDNLNMELNKVGSKLYMFYGDNIKVLNKLRTTIDIDNIIFNMDYTPYAISRDKKIENFCKKYDINMVKKEDYLLRPIGELNKENGDPYTVFTPFKNNGLKKNVDKPNRMRAKNLVKSNKINSLSISVDTDSNSKLIKSVIKLEYNNDSLTKGGRKEALKLLNKVKNHKKYGKERNIVSKKTTLLSSHIKFGCISIREVYWKIRDLYGKKSELLSQIFWRDFYYYITYYFPKVLKGKNYNEKYDKLKWKYSKAQFDKWCNGETGYPIIDAGMKELNKTGFMHNRARLFTSNFLNRMLGMDWRKGEVYFAKKLSDYDPAVNNGNWQWIASTGVDPKPYFQRLFNPWLQGKRFDPDAKYIKTWLPQLKNIPADHLLQWDEHYKDYDLKKINYVKPIVNYKEARQRSVVMYRYGKKK